MQVLERGAAMSNQIIRHPARRRFTQIDNRVIEDSRLTWQALGLFTYIVSKPDWWRVSVAHLASLRNLKRDGIYNALNNLIECGYVHREAVRDDKARYTGVNWYVFECAEDNPYLNQPLPDNEKPPLDLDEPYPANPYTAKPDTAKPTLVNTENIVITEVKKNIDKLSGLPAGADQPDPAPLQPPLPESRESRQDQEPDQPAPPAIEPPCEPVNHEPASHEPAKQTKDQRLNQHAAEALEYLNDRAGRKFRQVTTNLKFPRTRLREGFELADLKLVVDLKVAEWKDDPGMDQYLRPHTLFSEKFESYLQAALRAKENPAGAARSGPGLTPESTNDKRRSQYGTNNGVYQSVVSDIQESIKRRKARAAAERGESEPGHAIEGFFTRDA